MLSFLEEGMNKPPAPYGVSMSMLDQSPEGQELIRLFHQSFLDLCRDWFESREMILGLMRIVTEGMTHADKGIGLALLLYVALSHKYGFSLPVGGSGALSVALVKSIAAHGGEIKVSSPVKSFKLSGGECTGVVLESGEEILARKAVVSSLNVVQIPAMMGEDHLPQDFVKKTKRLKPSDFMGFHVELALNKAPKYKNEMTVRESWFLELVDHYDLNDYLRSFDDLVYGIPHTNAPLIICPTILDQGTRCPEGMHTLYVYEFAPYDLKDGGAEAWDDIKGATMEALIGTVKARTTNITDENILGKWAMSPLDYARYNPSWPKGDFTHFTSNITQQGANRPFPGWSHYPTPVKKLYLCGCSTHPGWAVTGAARATMWTVFEDLGMDFEKLLK